VTETEVAALVCKDIVTSFLENMPADMTAAEMLQILGAISKNDVSEECQRRQVRLN
jgi:hypothetical protein